MAQHQEEADYVGLAREEPHLRLQDYPVVQGFSGVL